MFPYNDTIIVTEYKEDLSTKDGIYIKGGDSANYFLGEVEYINDIMYKKLISVLGESISVESLKTDYLVVIGQLAKLPFINNRYIISEKDIRGIIDRKQLEEGKLFLEKEEK